MNNVLLTAEQAQQIEESLARISDKRNTHFAGDAQVVAGEALAIIQAARAQEPITTPDVCGEVCARAKLCYGCNKDLEEANAKYGEQAEQEPVAWIAVSDMLPIESDGEVLVRMSDGRCEIAWATYWHGASNDFAQWTFRDPDEDETPTHWMRIPK